VLPEPQGATPVYFVKLELRDSQARLISENFYWLRAPGVEDLQALQSLAPVKLESALTLDRHGDAQLARVRVSNPGSQLAFFTQVALTQGKGGPEILSVLWDDNYFSLLPGESREVTARFDAKDASRAKPVLEVGGRNVESAFHCENLKATPTRPRVAETIKVTASVQKTFLDGSRVWLRLNGAPTGAQWVWQREGKAVNVKFPLKLDRPGRHEITAGHRRLMLDVHP